MHGLSPDKRFLSIRADNLLASMLQRLPKINPLRPFLGLLSNFGGVEQRVSSSP
jgi:hypothetical protein